MICAAKRLTIFFVLGCLPLFIYGQGQSFVEVDSISVIGLKKTKKRIVLRELKFQPGDTIYLENLVQTVEESELLLMNTGLFSWVRIYYKNWDGKSNKVHFAVELSENWFLYPVPVFELVDRNFNVWWSEQGRSLKRINVGLEFAHLNFTGNNDRFKLGFKYGYTHSFSARYSLPFINKGQTLGISTRFSYRRNRELNYMSLDNQQEFYQEPDDFVFQKYDAGVAFVYRPKLRAFHEFSLGYTNDRIASIISNELNPNFFSNRDNEQSFFELRYKAIFDYRDIRPYPLNGFLLSAVIQKDGLGVFNHRDALTLEVIYDKYASFSERVSIGLQNKVKYSVLRYRQSYQYNRGLGFGRDYLRGYEFYIVDGLDMAYTKSSLRYKIFEKKLQLGKIVPIKAFRLMPLKMYFSVNNDIGYVNSPFSHFLNPLSNRLLWGGGIGVDFVVFYDKVFQIQYSFNDLLENGLFLHFDLNF